MRRPLSLLSLFSLSLLLSGCTATSTALPKIPAHTSLALKYTLPSRLQDFENMTFVDTRHGFLLGTIEPYSPTTTLTFAPYATSDSGATWRRLPFTSGWDPQALYFASPSAGFAMAESRSCLTNTGACQGAMLFTRDGGDSWQRARVPNLLYSVVWSDGARAMVTGSSPCLSVGCHPVSVLLSTADAGAAWQPLGPPGSQPEFSAISFSSARIGLGIDASGLIFSTVDGGQHWLPGQTLSWQGQPPRAAAAQFSSAQGVDFLNFCDALTAANGGCLNLVYRSLDGGHTWQMVYSLGCIQTSQLHMTSALTGTLTTFGWTACQGVPPDTSGMWRTTDGGHTFHLVHTFSPDTLEAEGFVGPRDAWIAAAPPACYPGSGPCGPIIAWSSDAGNSWRQVFPKIAPTEAIAQTPTGVVFGLGTALDPRAVLRLGAKDVWRTVGVLPSLGAPFNSNGSLAFSSDRIGFAAGAQGYLARTDDGGRTWLRVPLPAGLTYAAMAALPSGSLLFAGEPSLCMGEQTCRTELLDVTRSSPHGRFLHRFPSGWQIQGLAFVSPSRGYALAYDCTLKGPSCGSALFETANGGRSWQRSTPPNQGNFLESPAPGVLALTGPTYFLLHHPSSRVWREYAEKLPGPLYSIQFLQVVLRGKDVWLLSGEGVLYESTDGGRTWH